MGLPEDKVDLAAALRLAVMENDLDGMMRRLWQSGQEAEAPVT